MDVRTEETSTDQEDKEDKTTITDVILQTNTDGYVIS